MSALRGWAWFVRRFGVREAFFYWMAGRRQGWMTHDEFVDFIETRGSARPVSPEGDEG